MSGESDLIYLYDGSYEGMLCCVYESVYGREVPADIVPEDEAEPTLFCTKYIETDLEHAQRVLRGLRAHLRPVAREHALLHARRAPAALHGHVHQPHGLFLRAAVRPRDARDGDSAIAARSIADSMHHFQCALRADRAKVL